LDYGNEILRAVMICLTCDREYSSEFQYKLISQSNEDTQFTVNTSSACVK